MIEAIPRAAGARRQRLGSRSLPLALAAIGVALLILGAAEIAMYYSGVAAPPSWVVVLVPIVAWIYSAAGLVAWWRRPGNRLGPLLIAGAFVWLATGFADTSVPALIAVGLIVATVPLAIVVHMLHAFPSGRLRGRLSVVTVLVGYFVCIVLQAPVYLYGQGAGGPGTVLQVADRPDLARAGFWVQTSIGAAVMVVTALLLWGRLRRMSPAQRGTVGPLFAYGILAVLFVPVSGSLNEFLVLGDVQLAAMQLGVLAVLPVGFAIAILRGGFARTGELEELGAWLGAGDGRRHGLRDALVDALGDPSVELLFWVPASGGYVDGSGVPVHLPVVGSDRAAVEVTMAGRRVGAIVYDATLIADPSVARTAGRVVAIALDHDRLTAELRASRDDLRRSRARIVLAADRERRRIARDLHDGLQTRLVLLAIEAQRACAGVDDPERTRAATEALHSGLQATIADVRELVRGVMPAALTQGGLYAAAEELVDRAPVPIDLVLDPVAARLPAAVESTGYFVMSEALTNAIKHARAHELRIFLGQADGCLRIEVHDDGVGGARAGAGAGLRGMADRVESHDGRLVIDSPRAGGTRVLAEVPCES